MKNAEQNEVAQAEEAGALSDRITAWLLGSLPRLALLLLFGFPEERRYARYQLLYLLLGTVAVVVLVASNVRTVALMGAAYIFVRGLDNYQGRNAERVRQDADVERIAG
ncbi:MAG: hypothetical protein HOW73_43970 [Polyangiaceae bacterium]|nr:hypothetical protein [Polyangiaceae bacterium]